MGLFNFTNKQNAGKDYFSTAIYSATPQKKLTEEALLTIPSGKYAVELITNTIGSLPIYLYQESNSAIEKIENDPLIEMMERPNKYETSYSLKKKLVQDFLFYGKAYIYHKDDELFYLEARDMEERKYTSDGISFSRKEFIYNGYNGEITLPEHEIIVIDSGGNGVLVDGGDALSLALDQLEYERSLFKNGGFPTGVLQATSRLTQPAIERLRDSWQALYTGTSKAGKVLILEEGLNYSPLQMKPNDLMLESSKKMVNSDIARIFSIPETMIDASSNKYAANEGSRLLFYQNCISGILIAFEEAFNTILDKEFFFRFDVSELLRTTEKERVESTTQLFNAGLIDLNESRYRLDLPKVSEKENYKLFSLGTVIQHDENTISIPNMGIFKGLKLEETDDKN